MSCQYVLLVAGLVLTLIPGCLHSAVMYTQGAVAVRYAELATHSCTALRSELSSRSGRDPHHAMRQSAWLARLQAQCLEMVGVALLACVRREPIDSVAQRTRVQAVRVLLQAVLTYSSAAALAESVARSYRMQLTTASAPPTAASAPSGSNAAASGGTSATASAGAAAGGSADAGGVHVGGEGGGVGDSGRLKGPGPRWASGSTCSSEDEVAVAVAAHAGVVGGVAGLPSAPDGSDGVRAGEVDAAVATCNVWSVCMHIAAALCEVHEVTARKGYCCKRHCGRVWRRRRVCCAGVVVLRPARLIFAFGCSCAVLVCPSSKPRCRVRRVRLRCSRRCPVFGLSLRQRPCGVVVSTLVFLSSKQHCSGTIVTCCTWSTVAFTVHISNATHPSPAPPLATSLFVAIVVIIIVVVAVFIIVVVARVIILIAVVICNRLLLARARALEQQGSPSAALSSLSLACDEAEAAADAAVKDVKAQQRLQDDGAVAFAEPAMEAYASSPGPRGSTVMHPLGLIGRLPTRVCVCVCGSRAHFCRECVCCQWQRSTVFVLLMCCRPAFQHFSIVPMFLCPCGVQMPQCPVPGRWWSRSR